MKFLDEMMLKIKVARWSREFEEVNRLLRTGEDYWLALEILDRILKTESDPLIVQTVYLYKSMVLSFLGKDQEVIEIIDLLLDTNNELVDPVLSLKGDALRHLGRYQEACKVYEVVLKNIPKDIEVLLNNGFCLNALNRYQESINCFDKILEIEPYNIKAIGNKEYVLNKLASLGDETYKDTNHIIKILKLKIPDTDNIEAWCVCEQKKDEKWNVYMVIEQTKTRDLLRENIDTKILASFAENTLRIKL